MIENQEYSFKKFYSGISEDDQLMTDSSVLYSQGMDLTSNTSFAFLSRLPSIYLNPTDIIEGMYPMRATDYTSDIYGPTPILISNDRKVYKGNNSTPVFTLPSGRSFVAIFQMKDYLYFIRSLGTQSNIELWRISLVDAKAQSNWTSYLTQYTSAPLDIPTSDDFVILEDAQVTYVSIGKKIIRIDDTGGGVLATQFFNFCDDTIVGMEFSGSTIEVIQRNGRVNIWDGVSNLKGSTLRIDINSNIEFVRSSGSLKYMFGGNTLYVMNGYTPEPIISQYYSDVMMSPKVSLKKRKWAYNAITTRDGIAYMCGRGASLGGIYLTDITQAGCVVTFGKKIKALPYALNNYMFYSSRKLPFIDVYGVLVYQNGTEANMIISGRDATGYIVDWVNLSENNYITAPKGVILLRNFDGGLKEEKKKWVSVAIRANVPTDCNIKVLGVSNGQFGSINGDITTSTISGTSDKDEEVIMIDGYTYENCIALLVDASASVNELRRNNGVKIYNAKYIYG